MKKGIQRGFVRFGLSLVALCAAGVAQAEVPGLTRTKVIGYGWDLKVSTPAELIENAAAFDASGLDGVGVNITGVREDGSVYNLRKSTALEKWNREMLAAHVPYLRQFASHRGLRESLIVTLFQPGKRLDWHDDAQWAVFAGNMGLLAWLAREGGLKGLMIDNEDYPKQRQWFYDAARDGDDYDRLCALSRQRGREFGRAMFEAYPDMTLMFFFLLTEERGYFTASDPAVLKREKGDLWPAFVDGLVDVMPDGVKFVDGDEHAYPCDAENFDFYRHAWNQRYGTAALLAPENRDKYVRHLSVSGGLYLDMYANTNAASFWYFGPGPDGTRTSKFVSNLFQATRVASDYTWLWGEKRQYINWRADAPHVRAGKDSHFTALRAAGCPTWNDAIPGLTTALRARADPEGFARTALAADDATGRKGELLPEGRWKVWLDGRRSKGWSGYDAADRPRGVAGESLVLSNVVRGCFIKNVPVLPGQLFAVGGRIKGRGSISVAWSRGDKQLAESRVYRLPLGDPDADGWRTGATVVCVPPGADKLCVHPGSGHLRDKGEVTKFADLRVVRIGFEGNPGISRGE